VEHEVTDEFGVKSLVEVMASALAEGRSVSIMLDGGHSESVDHVACDQWHPLVEVRRTRDKHTLFLPAARIIAVDVGEEPSSQRPFA
jgi:hypothetical protein